LWGKLGVLYIQMLAEKNKTKIIHTGISHDR